MRRTRASKPVAPSKVRLSEHFLLSDFMGCNSVYVKGYKNVFFDPDGTRLDEGKYLCDTLLEPILADFGPFSVSYGYISPSLSELIVGYQDPKMPSYHRWDKGAAADICVHGWVKRSAPVLLAHKIDEKYAYSRLITYSESPFLCVSTQISEENRPRKAFYENRYPGKPRIKPIFIKKSSNQAKRVQDGETLELEHDWRGEGYPTYHGGGIRQAQHIRTSDFTVLSDFLYSDHAVTEGIPNMPGPKISRELFEQAGEVYDFALRTLGVPRISIVRAFESFRFNDYPAFSWKDHFAMVLIPPEYVPAHELADALVGHEALSTVSCNNKGGIVTVYGR